MAFKKKTQETVAVAANVSEWSVSDLSALYAEYRSSLIGQARRILRSDADAAEIVQEAFLKFIMAAPELDSSERALAYLRTTVNNLCLNQIRATGARPNLVAIDAETTQEKLAEISAQDHIPFDATLAAAEDAAIIREALSRLSQDQRTALVMWEMEGRSTEEIANALGTSTSNVRHVVARARQSFTRVLAEWIVDEATGTTALEALSSSYKKAAEIAKKSSKVALSLLIVLVAFLGFNSVTGREVLPNISTPSQEATQSQSSTPIVPSDKPINSASQPKKSSGLVSGVDVKVAGPQFPGLDTYGVPTGFSVTDGTNIGLINVTKNAPVLNNEGLVLHNTAMTIDNNGPAVLIDQNITVGGSGTTYDASVHLSVKRNWTSDVSGATNSSFERLPDGNYLLTAVVLVSSTDSAGILIPVSRGLDTTSAPTQITTKILMNSGKSQILAQAVYLQTK